MLEKYLQNIGLSDKEALVYLSLVGVDNAAVLDLSKKTKLKRPTVYVILESLSKKGLVSETTVGKKTHYQAEPPERLETFVERQKLVLDENSKRLKDIIPEIKSIQREGGERPVVKYFEGKEGILSMLEEVFGSDDGKKGEYIHVIYPEDQLKEVFMNTEREKYRNLRLKRGIKSKAIYTSSTERPSDETGDRIQINSEKYPLSCDITIYKDRLSISILGKKLSGIFIQSQDLANTLRSLFGLVFDSKK